MIYTTLIPNLFKPIHVHKKSTSGKRRYVLYACLLYFSQGLKGTGLYGSVTSKDLEHATPTAAPSVAAVGAATGVDIPVSNIRAVIAKRLTESMQTIPHYYLSVDVKMDAVMAMREQFNKMLEKEKIKLSVNDIIIKAIAMACKKVPEGNSAWLGNVIRQ